MGQMQEAPLNLKFRGRTHNFLFSTCPKYCLIYVYLKSKFNWRPILLFAKSGPVPSELSPERALLLAGAQPCERPGFLPTGHLSISSSTITNLGHFLAQVSPEEPFARKAFHGDSVPLGASLPLRRPGARGMRAFSLGGLFP